MTSDTERQYSEGDDEDDDDDSDEDESTEEGKEAESSPSSQGPREPRSKAAHDPSIKVGGAQQPTASWRIDPHLQLCTK